MPIAADRQPRPVGELSPEDVLRPVAEGHPTRRLGFDLGAGDLREVGRVIARGLSGARSEEGRAELAKRPRAKRCALHASLTPAAV